MLRREIGEKILGRIVVGSLLIEMNFQKFFKLTAMTTKKTFSQKGLTNDIIRNGGKEHLKKRLF